MSAPIPNWSHFGMELHHPGGGGLLCGLWLSTATLGQSNTEMCMLRNTEIQDFYCLGSGALVGQEEGLSSMVSGKNVKKRSCVWMARSGY